MQRQVELLVPKPSSTGPDSGSDAASAAISGNSGIGTRSSFGRKLFLLLNKLVDEAAAAADSAADHSQGGEQEQGFQMKHRHALFAVQLFLFLSLSVEEVSMDEAVLMFHRGRKDGERLGEVRGGTEHSARVIPSDLDQLLQRMNPQMVPAVLALELLVRVSIHHNVLMLVLVQK